MLRLRPVGRLVKGYIYIRRKRVVELVINGCERLGKNQAEIRTQVVLLGF
jgi:hypothetical protein